MSADDAIARKPALAIFSAGGTVSAQLAPRFAEVGCYVVDNSSYWRMDPSVPLIVPEINADVLTPQDHIIANPNCSTIQMVLPLAPLHKAYGIKRIVVSTYQSVTGAGQKGIEQLEVYQIWGFITSETGDYETKWGFAGMPGPFYVDGELKVVATSAPLEGDIKDYKTVIVEFNYETRELSNFKLFDKWAPDLFDETLIPVPDMVEPTETSSTDTSATDTSGTDQTTETT